MRAERAESQSCVGLRTSRLCLYRWAVVTPEGRAESNGGVDDIRVHGGLLDLGDAVPVDTTALQNIAGS